MHTRMYEHLCPDLIPSSSTSLGLVSLDVYQYSSGRTSSSGSTSSGSGSTASPEKYMLQYSECRPRPTFVGSHITRPGVAGAHLDVVVYSRKWHEGPCQIWRVQQWSACHFRVFTVWFSVAVLAPTQEARKRSTMATCTQL